MSAYRGEFNETKYVFYIKDNELLEKYNEIWGKVKKSAKKNLIVNLYTIKNI